MNWLFPQVSSEISALELRAARLRAREIPTEEADRTLREARLAFARVQDAVGADHRTDLRGWRLATHTDGQPTTPAAPRRGWLAWLLRR